MDLSTVAAICRQANLGTPNSAPVRIFGGLIHQMWRLTTDQGAFAIKQLSKLIKFDDGMKNAYEHSEQIARSFQQEGILAIAAILKNSHSIIELPSGYFLCYPWVNGKILSLKDISESHLIKMAKVLAQIHQISLRLFGPKKPKYQTMPNAELGFLIDKLGKSFVPFATLFVEHKGLLLEINQRYQQAIPILERPGLISHTDLDPKNVIWDSKGDPYLIDWESARAINATHDIIQLALDWAGLTICSINFTAFSSIMRSYQDAGGNIDKESIEDAFFAVLGNSLNWLVFNIKRGLDRAVGHQEQHLAFIQIESTLKSIVYLHASRAAIIQAASHSCYTEKQEE